MSTVTMSQEADPSTSPSASAVTLSQSDFVSLIQHSSLSDAIKSSILDVITGGHGASGASQDVTVVTGWQPGDTVPAGTDMIVAQGVSGNVQVPSDVPIVVFEGGPTVQVSYAGGVEQVMDVSSGNQNPIALSQTVAGGTGTEIAIGNDTVAGISTVDGGTGFTVVDATGDKAAYDISYQGTQEILTQLSTGHVYDLSNVSYVQFSDGVLINTGSEDHAVIARMYEAVFDRDATPAQLLSSYHEFDAQGATLSQIASQLLANQHFATTAQFVDAMYENLLQRAPTASEQQQATSELNQGAITKAQFLVSLASSAEAEAKTSGVIHIIHGEPY